MQKKNDDFWELDGCFWLSAVVNGAKGERKITVLQNDCYKNAAVAYERKTHPNV